MKNTIALVIAILTLSFMGLSQSVILSDIERRAINLGDVTDNNEDFAEFQNLDASLEGVEIVMLGEQSHGEATTYETKIKLIKYLHQHKGFDLLVFESGLYDCHMAWQAMINGDDARTAFGNSVFTIWSTTKELEPLINYMSQSLESEAPLELMGFDQQQLGKFFKETYLVDLTKVFKEIEPSLVESKQWIHLKENIALLLDFKAKKVKKSDPQQDTAFINLLIQKLDVASMDEVDTKFWIQTLESTKYFLSDMALKTNFRDEQMAKNLIWIKENNPGRKIICWGATSHFLYNSETIRMRSPVVQLLAGNYYKKQAMMGDYIKKQYGDKLLTIGFTAYQGDYGLFRRKKLKLPKDKSIEHLLGQLEYDNFFLSLDGLDLNGYTSRTLGNLYMKSNVSEVMDALIFNRYMRHPRLDNNFFLKIYPDNKYIKPRPEEEKTAVAQKDQADLNIKEP